MAVVTAEAWDVDDDALERYAATRDLDLREALVIRHLPLVKFVARRMSSNLPDNVDVDDLVSWGCIGLLDAIEKFQPERGHQFSTYAVTRIRGEILDGLQRMEWAPKQVMSKVRAYRRKTEALCQELGREPTDGEVADALGGTLADVEQWKRDEWGVRLSSLEGGHYDSDDDPSPPRELGRLGEEDTAPEVTEIRSRVASTLTTLDDRDRQVFILYYHDRLTLKEIAGQLGVSVSSATQSHTRLVDHVRDRLAAYGEVA